MKYPALRSDHWRRIKPIRDSVFSLFWISICPSTLVKQVTSSCMSFNEAGKINHTAHERHVRLTPSIQLCAFTCQNKLSDYYVCECQRPQREHPLWHSDSPNSYIHHSTLPFFSRRMDVWMHACMRIASKAQYYCNEPKTSAPWIPDQTQIKSTQLLVPLTMTMRSPHAVNIHDDTPYQTYLQSLPYVPYYNDIYIPSMVTSRVFITETLTSGAYNSKTWS